MNLKKIFLYTLLAVLLLTPSACASESDTPVILYDHAFDHVMDVGSVVGSSVANGGYVVDCFEMNVSYKWYTEEEITIGNMRFSAWLIYVPYTPTVTVKLTVAENNSVIWDIEPEFNRDSVSWKDQLIYLADKNGYKDGVETLLSPIDLSQILSDVDKEAPELFGQYICTRLAP